MECFPGATTTDLKSYCISSIDKVPECIALQVEIAEEIANVAKSIKNKDIEVKISGLVPVMGWKREDQK